MNLPTASYCWTYPSCRHLVPVAARRKPRRRIVQYPPSPSRFHLRKRGGRAPKDTAAHMHAVGIEPTT
jgi:hypothetical protein